jgi:hypothetical protein
MTRIRLIMLSLLATFALGAVGSASASADPCPHAAEGDVAVCHAGLEWEGTLKVKSPSSKLVGFIKAKAIIIVCKKDTGTVTIEDSGKTKFTITFEECKGEGSIAGCTIPNIKFNGKDQLLTKTLATERLEDELAPETGTTFVEIKVEKCALEGTYPVKGTQVCEVDKEGKSPEKINAEAEKSLETHKVICPPGKSHLTFGTEKAEFEGTEELSKEAGWLFSFGQS